ncbi:MAG: PIN domain-containing protein [Planctomycetes bacterium]|nr:PIN domain-containing protein [Planctomycetota bacterium]
MDKTLLDTDIFSEVLRGKNPNVIARATDYLAEHSRITISVVTVAEIVKGFHKRGDSGRLERFIADLTMFETVSLTVEASVIAGRIFADLDRGGQPIGRAVHCGDLYS